LSTRATMIFEHVQRESVRRRTASPARTKRPTY